MIWSWKSCNIVSADWSGHSSLESGGEDTDAVSSGERRGSDVSVDTLLRLVLIRCAWPGLHAQHRRVKACDCGPCVPDWASSLSTGSLPVCPAEMFLYFRARRPQVA